MSLKPSDDDRPGPPAGPPGAPPPGAAPWPTFQLSSFEVPGGAPPPAAVAPIDSADPSTLRSLCRLLNDPDVVRRRLAVDAMVQLGPKCVLALPVLAELLLDRETGVRARAAEVIAAIGPDALPAVEGLCAALNDRSELVRRWAAYALGEIGPGATTAVPALLQFRCGTADLKSRAVAQAALKRIDPEVAARRSLGPTTEPGGDEIPAAIAAVAPGELCRFYGHESWVQCVAFAPDGRSVLSGCGQPAGSGVNDYSVRQWDLAERTEKLCLAGHADRVTSVAFFPGSRYCATSSYDETVRVWDLDSGRPLSCLRGHQDRVRSVTVAADGRHLLSGGCDNTVILWDPTSATALRRFPWQPHWVIGLAFAPDGVHAMSGTLDGALTLWKIHLGRPVSRVKAAGWGRALRSFLGGRSTERAAPTSVTCVAFDPVRQLVAQGCPDNTVRLRDVATGREACLFSGQTAGVTGIAVAPDGRRILTGGMDAALRLWDAMTGMQIHCFEGHGDVITSVAFSADGQFAVSGSADRTVRVWRLPGGS